MTLLVISDVKATPVIQERFDFLAWIDSTFGVG